MKIFGYILAAVALASLCSCHKTIDKQLPCNELSLLELRIKGQMGTAHIERNGSEASATVYVMAGDDYSYSAVEVEGIVVSRYAKASVKTGQTLDFNNPEHKAKITVTSESGHTLDWWIYIEQYDAFYVGRWKITEIKLACNQRVAGCGDGSWTTQLSASEFGTFGKTEYDNIITITMDDEMKGNNLAGTITNDAGNDGGYADFFIVLSPYSKEEPLDMNPRLRHLLPAGTASWELDLTTNQMYITKDNITSTMTFGTDEYGNTLFRFILPSAAGEPSVNGTHDNMWRSSTELFYVVSKLK